MKELEIKQLFEQFESIACQYEGVECWSARELQHLLDYTKWENFSKVIDRAKESCTIADVDILIHFPDVRKMVEIGLGVAKEVDDILLTRYACYLVAQNGDSRKPQIAFAQTYFAVQTRRAELIHQRLLEVERVEARKKLQETEKTLSSVLYEHGVDDRGFAIIRSKGDQALFNLTTDKLKRKLKVPQNRPIADFLPTVSIKAKDLAAAVTSENVQRKNIRGVDKIEKEHVANNLGTRKFLIDRGIIPENLPPAEDVKKVERRLESEQKKLNASSRKKKK